VKPHPVGQTEGVDSQTLGLEDQALALRAG